MKHFRVKLFTRCCDSSKNSLPLSFSSSLLPSLFSCPPSRLPAHLSTCLPTCLSCLYLSLTKHQPWPDETGSFLSISIRIAAKIFPEFLQRILAFPSGTLLPLFPTVQFREFAVIHTSVAHRSLSISFPLLDCISLLTVLPITPIQISIHHLEFSWMFFAGDYLILSQSFCFG